MADFDDIIVRVTLTASALAEKTKALLVNVRGLAENDDDEGEKDDGVAIFGALGIVARPRSPDASGRAVGLAARCGDGLLPFAAADKRINLARGDIDEGAFSLAGYEGQHVTVEDAAVPGGKVLLSVDGATITIESGAGGPTITIAREGPPPSSITLGPGGNIALVGAAITFNGVPMQVP